MMIEVIVRISVFFSMAGFAIYLAGIAWLCFEETRPPGRRRVAPAPKEHGLLAVMNDGVDQGLVRSTRRCEGTLQRVSID
jgi:hypothetical protein